MFPRAHCRTRQESAGGPFLAAPISICYDMLVKQAERMIR